MSIDLAGMESDRDRYRLDGNAREQLEKKTLPALAAFGCIGTVSGSRMGLAVGLAVVIEPVWDRSRIGRVISVGSRRPRCWHTVLQEAERRSFTVRETMCPSGRLTCHGRTARAAPTEAE